ncbi:hypothetical protein [Limnohabitans sp. G3-2]|uniref:hypothetical protein n=1 Tax=Limnohabitans sp. G3-2 TaxID=1100711 RepID=UPI000C1E989D|nr:hypothetical protein [Limnohabitans sp. G3-2]PIT78149.1 hypothetical protein B9Z31_01455 [Limnohabitans sp. G3-2]
MTPNPTPELIEHLGPAPFRFVPRLDPMRSPAFSGPFKAMAIALLSGLAFWAYQLHGAQLVRADHLWLWAAWGIMAYTVGHVLRGQTTLTAKGLAQTWIWDKQVELRDLAYAKLIRIPGLDWLVAPRLYVRTLMGKFTVIYASDPNMVEEFKRLSTELKAFRSM